MASPIDTMILRSVKCVKCGAAYGACSCWENCPVCRRTIERGKPCRNCASGGSEPLRVIAASRPRKRKSKGE